MSTQTRYGSLRAIRVSSTECASVHGKDVIKSVTNYAEVGERNPQLMCEELLEECLVKQSKDNMSAIIVLLQAADSMVEPYQSIFF